MTISREAKILIGIVALAGAAWLWINALSQPSVSGMVTQATPLVSGQPTSSIPLNTPGVAMAEDGEASELADTDEASVETEADGVEPIVPGSPAVSTPIPSGDARVAELPFLVTEPPLDVGQDDLESTLQTTERPQELRATVNPFSPIVIRPAPVTTQPAALAEPTIPAAQSDISVVEIPIPTAPDEPMVQVGPGNGNSAVSEVITSAVISGNGGGSTVPTVSAPVPRPVTPTATNGVALPRPLPSGTLPTTPDILREVRASSQPSPIATIPAPVNVGEVAALRLPENSVVVTELPTQDVTEQNLEPIVRAAALQTGNSSDPLNAGISEMSRYLRDNNYRFTGAVIGPVSVGVFRSNSASAPVVVPLGQTLPNTEIVLTSLQGKQAEFTQGTMKYSLVLDLR